MSFTLSGVELRSLRQLQRSYPDSPFLFVSERGSQMTADAARKVIVRAGELAKLPFPSSPPPVKAWMRILLGNERA